jgi:GNAT superfamily N-acetyltransferase
MAWHLHLENHWLACMAQLAGGARVYRVPGALVVANPEAAGLAFNFIALRGADPGHLAATLEQGSALLAGEGRAPALFLSPAGGETAALQEALRAAGWSLRLQQVVLSRDPRTQVDPTGPAAIQVERIGPDSLALWSRTLVEAYEVEPRSGANIAGAWAALQAEPGESAEARFYLASVEGKPVGTGLAWIRGETAGLYCGAVLPHARRQGVERATLLRRMADAAAVGCHTVLLQTDPGSPVEHLCVNRLGFRSEYVRELWGPATP